MSQLKDLLDGEKLAPSTLIRTRSTPSCALGTRAS